MDLQCDKCGYILLEDNEVYLCGFHPEDTMPCRKDGKRTELIGFKCSICGTYWFCRELAEEEREITMERYKDSKRIG